MIDGLTPDKIKRKYIWLLNAIVENAIIGEDEYGLVWYSGNWKAGEWEDGTWYSGIWEDGEWKNGNFYSYKFDNKLLLQRNKRILEKDNPEYSQFRRGIWRRGNFYNGIFGPIRDVEDWDSKGKLEIYYNDTRWESGVFYNGIFRNSSWLSVDYTGSTFKNGIFYNSEWINGTFFNGTFQGYRWHDGIFNGGDFVGNPYSVNGDGVSHWLNGSFNQINPNIKSRFGSYPVSGTTNLAGTSVMWHNGTFFNGEFHSGLNLQSGIEKISDNHNRTVWLDGVWLNGIWYGGTHKDGVFNNGYWYEGIWSGGTFNGGVWYNGIWLNGDVNGGMFQYGNFDNLIFNKGYFGYQSSQQEILMEKTKREITTYNPKLYEN